MHVNEVFFKLQSNIKHCTFFFACRKICEILRIVSLLNRKIRFSNQVITNKYLISLINNNYLFSNLDLSYLSYLLKNRILLKKFISK